MTGVRAGLLGAALVCAATVGVALLAVGPLPPDRCPASEGAIGPAVTNRPALAAEESPQLIDPGVEALVPLIGRATLEALSPQDLEMIVRRAMNMRAGTPSVAVCFAEGTDEATIAAFNAFFWGDERYNQDARWNSTATNGATGAVGTPITLTYSFVPDGTMLPGGVGEPASASDLFAVLNGIYGSPAAWQPLYAQVFARWSELCGIDYVLEPNDDGASFPGSVGSLGVRGDLRMAGHLINGNGGVLAYNNFPSNGDMVIDTGDSFYANTADNSLGLRNVLAHENGHGIGQRHVCPVTRRKLMEPTVSTLFDGPRHDDVRNAQRYYGDPSEPDETSATAFVLGNVGVGTVIEMGLLPTSYPEHPISVLSIDADGEVDFSRITTTEALRLTVTVTPVGVTYDDAVQSCGGEPSSCCKNSFRDSAFEADLGVQVRASNGTLVLGQAQGNPAGAAETVSDLLLSTPGNYFVRVYETSAPTQTQMYHVKISGGAASLPLRVTLPSAPPTLLAEETPANFSVTITPGGDTLVPGSPTLWYSYDGGPFQSTPLTFNSGISWTATLPAASCIEDPLFYVSAQGTTTGMVTQPSSGAASPFSAPVGAAVTVASFDFETAVGWAVTNDAFLVDGAWDRGVPVYCARGDPPFDYDGSGQCFFTANTTTNTGCMGDPVCLCNTDVDGGATTLTSPVFDLTDVLDPVVNYARWYSNAEGGAPQTDTFEVEVSSDSGMSWTTLETVGPDLASTNGQVAGDWFFRSLPVPFAARGTSGFQVRFIAQDSGSGALVEAGIDSFSITGRTCSSPVGCPGDADGNLVVNFVDVLTILANFGGSGPLGDSDGNGIVNFNDVLASLANFGADCS